MCFSGANTKQGCSDYSIFNRQLCIQANVPTLQVSCHWMHNNQIKSNKDRSVIHWKCVRMWVHWRQVLLYPPVSVHLAYLYRHSRVVRKEGATGCLHHHSQPPGYTWAALTVRHQYLILTHSSPKRMIQITINTMKRRKKVLWSCSLITF